jgi:uncharacterized membrane protein YfcA
LQIFFGLFLLPIAYSLFVGKLSPAPGKVASQPVMRGVSVLVGCLSGLLGIGGGLILIPFLIRCGIGMREATGTSVACGMCIGIVASLSFMVFGSGPQDIPWSTGFIYWPAFLGIGVASVIFAPIGTAIAYRLPTALLKRALAVFLLLISIQMLFPVNVG